MKRRKLFMKWRAKWGRFHQYK